MPKGKGTYGSKRGRPPKKKNPIAGAGRAARGVAGAAMGIAGKAIKRKPAQRYAKSTGRAGMGTVRSMKRKKRTTKRSSYL
ncbi:MAG: hypothetical protein CMC15_13760 [Flavobacteriaceae bacterium]|nr:hypothetical protein [Flavobacteriaceae bacterium]